MLNRFDTAKLVPWTSLPLRLFLGLGFIAHGAQKLFGAFGGPGMNGTIELFRSVGIPAAEAMAWLVAIVELAGGALLLAGLATRPVAAILAAEMLVAAITVHLPQGFFAQHGGMELPLACLAGLLCLFAFGGGALSADAHASRLAPKLREIFPKRAEAA